MVASGCGFDEGVSTSASVTADASGSPGATASVGPALTAVIEGGTSVEASASAGGGPSVTKAITPDTRGVISLAATTGTVGEGDSSAELTGAKAVTLGVIALAATTGAVGKENSGAGPAGVKVVTLDTVWSNRAWGDNGRLGRGKLWCGTYGRCDRNGRHHTRDDTGRGGRRRRCEQV